MIVYEKGGLWYLFNVFACKGSVFPKALVVALPGALAAAFLTIMKNAGHFSFLEAENSVLDETQAWSGFSFLVGFLIVFRTSQAYNRFWDGCKATHQMRAEWFDACSALVAFCRHSKADEALIMQFKNTLVRLFSMLHATALAELEEINCEGTPLESIKAYSFELLDAFGIDEHSLHAIQHSHSKVELIFEWIQLLIVDNIDTGVLSIPPPILSRAFQEAANGMVAFHDALKMTYIPFPFPYAQACDCCLLLHWIIAPFVTSQWVRWPFWSFVFVGVQIFILWSLNFIAVEIENPFGTDSNDLDGEHMQKEMNRNLVLLLNPDTIRVPELADRNADQDGRVHIDVAASFLDVWRTLPPRTEQGFNLKISVESAVSAISKGAPALAASSARKGEKFIHALKHADDRKSDGRRKCSSSSHDPTDWTAFRSPSISSALSRRGTRAVTEPAYLVPDPAVRSDEIGEKPGSLIPGELPEITRNSDAVGPVVARDASESASGPGSLNETESFSSAQSSTRPHGFSIGSGEDHKVVNFSFRSSGNSSRKSSEEQAEALRVSRGGYESREPEKGTSIMATEVQMRAESVDHPLMPIVEENHFLR